MTSNMDIFKLKLEILDSISFIKGLICADPDNPKHRITLRELRESIKLLYSSK